MSVDFSSYLPPLVLPDEREYELVEWNLPIKHWSPSSLAMFQRCPRQWQERYIHGIKARPAEAPVLGTTVHKAVEMNYGQKIESHEDMPLAQLLDYYETAFPVVVEQEQEKAGEEMKWDTTPEKAMGRGKQMLSAYQSLVAERVQPIAVELFVTVDLGLPVPVEGRADVDTEKYLVDLKTGRRALSRPQESHRIQGVVYGKARGKGIEFQSVTISDKAEHPKPKIVTALEEPELFFHPSHQEQAVMEKTLASLSEFACFLMAKYGPDEPWPTYGRFHSWACDYCGYLSTCPAWRTT